MPSLYVTSILFYACEEVHRVGGHVLDKQILQNFAKRLFDKVCSDSLVRLYIWGQLCNVTLGFCLVRIYFF